MRNNIPAQGSISWVLRLWYAAASALLLMSGFAQTVQAQTNPLNIFQNYFVTGDYVVAGWVEGAPDGSGYAPGLISIPDTRQPSQNGVPATVPTGADIVAAYLYWATVEGNQSSFAGQNGFFNNYPIAGTVLGNPNAPTSWSAGGCSGGAQGSKTMRTYRADVRPYLPLDTNSASPTFGTLLASGSIPVRLVDSGSNGNTAPNALGATLVIIYRVLAPVVPLNSIVLYDGAFAPSNSSSSMSQPIVGFYQAAQVPIAKITHIVANGQPNKSETVMLNSVNLPSLYGALPPFPGVYGTWDNPTWLANKYGAAVIANDSTETASVLPAATNSGCVSWGAVIFSSTVQDTDGDGLLDVWETNQGYTDAVSGQLVALPGANKNVKDIFVEVDYLQNLDGKAGNYLHSHLPKQAALDIVGNALSVQNIKVHFDLGQNIYPGDLYVVSTGTGGNAISEGDPLVLCTDGSALCPFPGQPAVGWKGGFALLQNTPTLGNFQPGRAKSYHYVLFGHSLGAPESLWSTAGTALADPTVPQLVSIVISGTTATVKIQSPQGVVKPGDCPNAALAACSGSNNSRVTVDGALGQPFLNGTYFFNNPTSTTSNNVTTTTFTITTANVATGTYTFNNEPQLNVSYLGPTSTSGHSDFGGGGDSAVTLGLWAADDPSNCQGDPSQPLTSGQVYCNNQMGSVTVQAGTLLHELGHALTLTHGGTYYDDAAHPSLAAYDLNCKPNYMSVMNYLFQIRGFVDGGFDLSGQSITLHETQLNETLGLGLDSLGNSAAHLTRWYSSPNQLDTKLQNTTGGRYATRHCDGTPLGPNDVAAVRVDGAVVPGGTFSGPLDWNNDLVVPDAVSAPGVDVNYNGITGDSSFLGFNDWQVINPANGTGSAMDQMGARAGAFGFSGAGGIRTVGGGIRTVGGGTDAGGGIRTVGGGIRTVGGGIRTVGGGTEQDENEANSTADAPSGLTCTNCVVSSGTLVTNGKSVSLAWTPPGFGQIRKYSIWRAVGSFPTIASVVANINLFSNIQTLTGAPPSPKFTDNSKLKNGTTYTYFVTDGNKQGAQSGPSAPAAVTVKF
jgi:hypothetical protein